MGISVEYFENDFKYRQLFRKRILRSIPRIHQTSQETALGSPRQREAILSGPCMVRHVLSGPPTDDRGRRPLRAQCSGVVAGHTSMPAVRHGRRCTDTAMRQTQFRVRWAIIATYSIALMETIVLCVNSCAQVSREPITATTFRYNDYISGWHPDTNCPPVMIGFPVAEKK